MRIKRWYVGQYNYHGAPSDSGQWCEYTDVARLERSHSELLKALKLLLAEYEHQVWIGNMSTDRVELDTARVAIAKAEGEEA